MSGPEHQDGDKRHHEHQVRPPWGQPEESCGGFITKLPGPRGKSVWMAVGRAANVWQNELSSPILELVKNSEAAFGSGLSLFMYMVGRDRSTASPRIIFCSRDMKTRKAIRKAVETSGILKNYPSIGLGDSSSPLTREDSGLRLRALDFPTPAKLPGRRSDRSRDAGAPQDPVCHAQQAHPGSEAALVPPARAGGRQAQQHGYSALIRPFQEIFITPRRPASFSCDDSAYGTLTESLDSNPSRSSTPTSLVHGMLAAGRRAPPNTPKMKALNGDGADSDKFDSADDPESYSESDDMEEPTALTPADLQPAISRELSPIVNRVITAYEDYRRRGGAESSNRTPRNAECTGTGTDKDSSGARGGIRNDGTSVLLGKRPFSEQDDTGYILNTDSKRTKTSKLRDEAFACPYWKKDTQAYFNCSKFKFEEVRRVKQHLYRNHSRKIRCPRCQEVFPNRDSCDSHLEATDCARRPKVFDEGIDQDLAVKLNKRGPATLDQVQRWYVVWDIIFPGVDRPVSPFHDDGSVSLSQFQQFLRQEGSAIILNHMRRSPNWNRSDEERFSHGPWRTIFDEIERQWLARRGAGSNRTPVATGTTAELLDGEPSTDLALDSSPSPLGAGGVYATDDAQGGDGLNIVNLRRDPYAFNLDEEVSGIDGEQYVLADEDSTSAYLCQWTNVNFDLGSSS